MRASIVQPLYSKAAAVATPPLHVPLGAVDDQDHHRVRDAVSVVLRRARLLYDLYEGLKKVNGLTNGQIDELAGRRVEGMATLGLVAPGARKRTAWSTSASAMDGTRMVSEKAHVLAGGHGSHSTTRNGRCALVGTTNT